MKKFKYILLMMLMITATVVINGGTRVKCSVKPVRTAGLIRTTVVESFPDLISFTNYINQ